MNNNSTNAEVFYLPAEYRSKNCDVWLENAQGSWTMVFVQSILIDFLGGIIACISIYQFYRGIEISHPIFAVLFNNLIFSTILSITSFVITCLMYFDVLSCRFNFSFVFLNCTAVSFMNIIAWVVIALLKYYLLSKAENNNVDLAKLRNIGLVLNWCMFFGVVGVRILLNVLVTFGAFPIRLITLIMVLLFVLNLICYSIVNYKTDTMLKEKLRNSQEIDKSDITSRGEPANQVVYGNGRGLSYHNQNGRLDCKSRFTSSQAISIELGDYGGVYIGDNPREEKKDRKENVKVTTSDFSFGEESRADDSNITFPNQVPETNSDSSNAARATAPKLDNRAENDRNDSNIEALYKESKEHESIKRAIISYVIYFFATLIGLSFIDFLAAKVDDSPIAVYTIIIFSSFYKLQRTFATLIMSIYCFERLHHLYKQTIENF